MYLALVPGIFLALYLGLTIPIRYGRRWARVSVWFLAGLGLISLAAPVDSIVGTILTFTGASTSAHRPSRHQAEPRVLPEAPAAGNQRSAM